MKLPLVVVPKRKWEETLLAKPSCTSLGRARIQGLGLGLVNLAFRSPRSNSKHRLFTIATAIHVTWDLPLPEALGNGRKWLACTRIPSFLGTAEYCGSNDSCQPSQLGCAKVIALRRQTVSKPSETTAASSSLGKTKLYQITGWDLFSPKTTISSGPRNGVGAI